MTFKHKVNQGSVFRNDKQISSQPNFTGSANIGGVEYNISMWTNPPKDGKQGFYNIRFVQKDDLPNV